jgi:hypothetical protein
MLGLEKHHAFPIFMPSGNEPGKSLSRIAFDQKTMIARWDFHHPIGGKVANRLVGKSPTRWGIFAAFQACQIGRKGA